MLLHSLYIFIFILFYVIFIIYYILSYIILFDISFNLILFFHLKILTLTSGDYIIHKNSKLLLHSQKRKEKEEEEGSCRLCWYIIHIKLDINVIFSNQKFGNCYSSLLNVKCHANSCTYLFSDIGNIELNWYLYLRTMKLSAKIWIFSLIFLFIRIKNIWH